MIPGLSRFAGSNSRFTAPNRPIAAAESSQPGQAGAPAGVRPPRPAPSSRMRQSAAAFGPVNTALSRQDASAASLRAASAASASDEPAVSANSQPPPRGSPGTAAAP